MPHEKPIGIDLGTTNSAMAWVDASGRSATILNAEGELITPSVVYFSEQEVVVGKNARTAITAHPDMVAQWVKRDMGAPYYSHPIRGQFLPPEVIQACILRKLKADLVRAVGPDMQTVITVPAYFDEMRRKATADAGEMAGLKVLDIVNEPTAAALAFGEALGYLSPTGRPLQNLNVLVYDLGGGTFDVTLLNLSPGKVKTLATDGDVQLGGHDWDQRLVDHAADAFIKMHGSDPRQDPATLNRMFLDAMEAKHTLSARSRAAIQINYLGRYAEVSVTREQFEEMSADLMERTLYTARQLLGVAGLEWKDVQRLLLVGGSTRMPMVPRMLQALSGIQPDRTVNPDEAVARGAALYAGHLLSTRGGAKPSSFQVVNVNAHSLGIEGIDTDTLRKKNVVLIPRNTALPAKHTERFATKSGGQKSIVIKVLEGESSLPNDCIAIGRTVVRDLPAGLPKGWPIEITFEYGTNSRLSVHATVPGTHHEARLELLRETGLSSDGLARWKQVVGDAGGIGTFESTAQDVLHSPSPRDGSPSTIGMTSATGFALTGATAAPAPSPAVSPASPQKPPPTEPAQPTHWVSGPQPLTTALPAMPATGSPMVNADPTEPLIKVPQPAKTRRLPKWAWRAIGHVVAIVLFGILGFVMIRHLRPDIIQSWFGGHGKVTGQDISKPAP